MAKRPSRAPRGGTSTRPAWTRLGVLVGLIVILYGGLALSGHFTPKLGLDLQGGTTVTLSPKPGQTIKPGAIDQAVEIIRLRVNGLGVAEAEVVKAGDHIEISVPGKGRDDVVNLVGQTAALSFRIPYTEAAAVAAATPSTAPSGTVTPTPGATATPSAAPSTSATPSAPASVTPSASTSPKAGAAPQLAPAGKRAVANPALYAPSTSPAAATAAPSAAATPAAAATPSAAASATPAPNASATVAAPCISAPGSGSTPPSCITAQFAKQTCSKYDIRGVNLNTAKPSEWLVACDATGQTKYILKPQSLPGTIVDTASAQLQQGAQGTTTGNWVVAVDFTSSGQSKWADLTGKISSTSGCPTSSAPQCQLAIVLDGVVQSSPVIQQRIAGSAEISGSFTQSSAEDLANVLKYGSLPVAFERSAVVDVSATLGRQSLNAGLLAGAIGLGLVIIYSFFYYRALGVVTVVSLAISGLSVYGCIVALGQLINFTLTLAGIAGFIVAVGITADSFVVFYERLKDEVHEGRSVRASVERAWVRARRTILSADTVSFLAAAALYWLSIGSVRGFAFTLGLSTLLDLVVVFLFTKPMVTLLVRKKLFSTSRFSGLTPKALGESVTATAGPAPRMRLSKRTGGAPDSAANAEAAPPGTDRPAGAERDGS